MVTGYRGLFVVPWVQTEIDGIHAAGPGALVGGAQWRWWGEPVRVDGPAGVLLLDGAEGQEELRHHAARSAARLLGRAGLAGRQGLRRRDPEGGRDLSAPLHGFTVTDGRRQFTGAVMEGEDGRRLVAFEGGLPPRDTDLHVTGQRLVAPTGAHEPGVICFAAGTRIDTPDGPRPVEAIRPGDRIDTRDNGPQEVVWTGQRRMSGARLYAMPAIRPVRLRAGAVGEGRPDSDLVVSPEHRILIRSDRARLLFNEVEVLVAARDLVDGRTILTETGLREVHYHHLMTERHEIVRANGVEAESFHPARADFGALTDADRDALVALWPALAADPHAYGADARRSLTRSEVAILQHAAA